MSRSLRQARYHPFWAWRPPASSARDSFEDGLTGFGKWTTIPWVQMEARLAISLLAALLAGCGGASASVSPSAARAAYECDAVKALQAGDAKIPQLEAAVETGDPRRVALAANAVLLEVMPAAADRSSDFNPSDTLDPLVSTALWDLVEIAGDLETSFAATPVASAVAASPGAVVTTLARAHLAVQSAVRERDRLVAAGSLKCP